MYKDAIILVMAGVALFFRELISKCAWAFVLFLGRGEFNDDNDEKTPDKFDLLNPCTDSWCRCYIIRYHPIGVTWGFFREGEYVEKTSNWLDWANFRGNRFSIPRKVDREFRDYLDGKIKVDK